MGSIIGNHFLALACNSSVWVLKLCFLMDLLMRVFTFALDTGTTSSAKLRIGFGPFFVSKKSIRALLFFKGFLSGTLKTKSFEMMNSTQITEHVNRCFLIIQIYLV